MIRTKEVINVNAGSKWHDRCGQNLTTVSIISGVRTIEIVWELLGTVS
jgi:hypothetical protein